MSGGRRGDRRGHRYRSSRRNDKENEQLDSSENRVQKTEPQAQRIPDNNAKGKSDHDRPYWTPPAASTEPIPAQECLYCGKPIKELTLAISDKNTGGAIHFECIISRISRSEILGIGDAVSYLGGGRFGIIHYNNPSNPQGFSIKKIFEWEIKENRAVWRQVISDHYSVT